MITTKKVGRPRGHKLSEETKTKIANSKIGNKHSEETKKRISEGVLRKAPTRTGVPIEILMNTDLTKLHQIVTKRGYVNLSISSEVGLTNYTIREHVAVMEQHIGRKLLPGEEVHHYGDKTDNRIEMLHLCRNRQEHMILDRLKRTIYKAVEKACESAHIYSVKKINENNCIN